METIKISIIDTRLDDMGIDSKDEWVDFKFKPKDLIDYWVIPPDEGEEPIEIKVYIGGSSFVSPMDELNKIDQILEYNKN